MSSSSANATMLYVGDLDPTVTQEDLENFFSDHNVKPHNCELKVNSINGESMGYAIVSFMMHSDAKIARETLNFKPIKKKECRIMWFDRSASLRKSGKGNLFLNKLPPGMSPSDIHDKFSDFGTVVSVKRVCDSKGVYRGYGYVQFESVEEADKAIEAMKNDSVMSVSRFVPKNQRPQAEDHFTNVYVKNIPQQMTHDHFNQKLASFGDITKSHLSDIVPKYEAKYGMANFSTHESAAKAVGDLNGQKWEDNNIFISRAMSKKELNDMKQKEFEKKKKEMKEKYRGTNLFVKNFPKDMTEADFRKMFEKYGVIRSIGFPCDEKGIPKGYGFCAFEKVEEANAAMSDISHFPGEGGNIYVTLALPKDEFSRSKSLNNLQYGNFRMFQYPMMARQQAPPMMGPPAFANPRGFPYPFVPHNYSMMPPYPSTHRQIARGRPMGTNVARNPRQPVQNYPKPVSVHPAPQPVQVKPPAPKPVPETPNGDRELANQMDDRTSEIGEVIYDIVEERYPEHSSRITGIIINSLKLDELERLIRSKDELMSKVEEALKLITSK